MPDCQSNQSMEVEYIDNALGLAKKDSLSNNIMLLGCIPRL